MTGSTNSLESSLSPAPEPNTPAEPTSAGLDSGSELSELTDEETEARNTSRRGNWRRRRRPGGSRRGGRRKRSNLVPAPMWGWAEQKANAAEEEEEEVSEPAHPMEEEEGPEEEEETENTTNIPDDKVNDSDEDQIPGKPVSSEDEDQIEDPVSDNETESEDDDDEPKTKLDDLDVDVTATAPEDVPPIVAAAAASSIMAGSQVIADPPSPSSTDSAASSRAPTPIPAQSDTNTATKDKASHLELTNEPPDIDETAAEEDIEAELELQPAHRAEALDFLAIIELKFALLREKLYVEKMQALAWEETLIDRGTHPELLHLHKELSKRRDKRLELATRKRALEVANVNKRRRVDENATWSWWKLARDELQTEMIAETNRKRRRLERERRAVERPQPVRRIPNPPVEIPIPPSVRALVDSHSRETVHPDDAPQSLVYPQLSTLSSAEVNNDLDFFYMHRQYDPARNPNAQMTHGVLPQPPIGYESYADNAYHPRPLPGPPAGYHHSAPPPQQAMVGPGQAGAPYAQYNTGAARSAHHHHPPGIHGPSPFPPDQDPGWSVPGPSSGVGFAPHGLHGRRSVSPPGGVKSNGQWMGPGMSMVGFHVGREAEEEERRDREKREREHQEMDRQRDYHMQNLQQQQHARHGHQHNHVGPPPQAHGVHHHHGRSHHHHVLHHHAPPPPSGPALSPRASRDIEARHPTEVINLSSNKGHWKEEVNDKRARSAAAIIDDRERERPLAMPFTMTASQHSPPRPSTGASTPPRNSWNQDDMHRPTMSHDSPGRYPRIGPLADRSRALPPPSPSSIPPQYGSPTARSPTRYRERSPTSRLHRPLSPQSKNPPLLPPLSTPNSRVPSPLLTRGPGDRDQAISPRPPKMTVTQMID